MHQEIALSRPVGLRIEFFSNLPLQMTGCEGVGMGWPEHIRNCSISAPEHYLRNLLALLLAPLH